MNGKRMIFGFIGGIAMIALAIAAIPFSADAQIGAARTTVTLADGCQMVTVALDEGYGLTRTAEICR